MKKSMLCAGMIILSASAYAEVNGKSAKVSAKKARPNTTASAASLNSTPKTTKAVTPVTEQPAKNPEVQTTPALAPENKPAVPASTAVAAPKPLDCNYRIPAETTRIEQTIVLKWAEKATEQSFNFDHNQLDKQLSDLKACYTDQGWQGFNDALQKSGNLNAIKTQQLMVSSMIKEEGKIIEVKDNQWKVTLPLQVVYQNDKEKLTQPLTVNLVIGRKISGDLGIMQMIAIPNQATNPPAKSGENN